MERSRSDRAANPKERIVWCVTAATATIHAEMMDVFRSSFWPGLDLQDALGALTAVAILATAIYAATACGKTLTRRARPSAIRDPLIAIVVPTIIAIAYTLHGDESVAKLAIFAVASIATLWLLHYAANTPAIGALVAIALAFAATYAAAEWQFAYPKTRASSLLWIAPASVIVSAFVILLGSKTNHNLFARRTAIGGAAVAATVMALYSVNPARAVQNVADRPNLVLISFDAMRADYSTAYGGQVHTPAMNALAEQGVVFNHAYSLAPWTVPSMYGMFTSRYPLALPANASFDEAQAAAAGYRFEQDGPTLAESLQQRGYATAAYIGNPLLGSPEGILRGFDTTRAWPAHSALPTGPFAQLPGLRGILNRWFHYAPPFRPIDSGEIIAKCARRFIGDHANQPFFVWVHMIDPHDPYDPPSQFRSQSGPWTLFSPISNRWGTPQLDAHGNIEVAPENRPFVRSLYEGEIAYADRRLAEITRQLDSRDLRDRTYTCVTADHGEELWDHGRFGHGQSLHDELVRIPLLIAGPDVEPTRVTNPVSNLDLMPTLAALLNVDPNPAWRGISYAQALRGHTSYPDRLAFAQATNCFAWPNVYRMARLGNWKLIENQHGGAIQLYNLATDPREMNDRAHDDADAADKMRTALTLWLNDHPELETGTLEGANAEMIESLKSMGYID